MKKSLIIIFVILSIHQGYAQHNHSGHNHNGDGGQHSSTVEKSPHGGQMKQIGKYKVEMVSDLFLSKDQISFYLFQKNLKPITNASISGFVKIHYNDGTESESELVLKQGNRFVSQINKTVGFHCIIEMVINEKEIKVDFVQKGL